MKIRIRRAEPADAAVVEDMLIEAARWVDALGVVMWEEGELGGERIAREVAAEGTVYRVTRGGRGAMVLVDEEYFDGWMAAIEEMQRVLKIADGLGGFGSAPASASPAQPLKTPTEIHPRR